MAFWLWLKKVLFDTGDEEEDFKCIDEELLEKYNELHDTRKEYGPYMDILLGNKYSGYINNREQNGYMINHQGNVFRNCFDDLMETGDDDKENDKENGMHLQSEVAESWSIVLSRNTRDIAFGNSYVGAL